MLEYFKGYVFAHITFYGNSFEAYKKTKREFHTILDFTKSKGYNYLLTYTKNAKFVKKLYNPEYVSSFTHNNEIYEVYRWDLTQYQSP